MNLMDGDEIVGMQLDHQGESLLIVSEKGYGKRTLINEFGLQYRGGKGVKCYKILEKTGDVRYYLHNHGIDTVDYSPEHESWFELLPSEEETTIRPALVSEGRLLVKGLAAGGM